MLLTQTSIITPLDKIRAHQIYSAYISLSPHPWYEEEMGENSHCIIMFSLLSLLLTFSLFMILLILAVLTFSSSFCAFKTLFLMFSSRRLAWVAKFISYSFFILLSLFSFWFFNWSTLSLCATVFLWILLVFSIVFCLRFSSAFINLSFTLM